MKIAMARRGGRMNGRGGSRPQESSYQDTVQPGNWKFGTIYALQDAFGFLRAMHHSEDVYFSLRNTTEDFKQGDLVYYQERQGDKGPSATRLFRLPLNEQQITASNIKAIVKISSQFNKPGSTGILTVQDDASSLNGRDIPFLREELNGTRGVSEGSLVQCDIIEIPQLGHIRAQNITVLKSARDAKLQQMLASGHPRDEGIIDKIYPGYGFIRCVDRRDDLYFRREDVCEPEDAADSNWQLTSGLEVEFFIVEETGKHDRRDRAVLIHIVPPGTVQFEVDVASSVSGVVTVPPRAGPSEVPGIVQVVIDGSHNYPKNVELWPRVMSSNVELHQGDVLQFDIMKYRPQSVYFARNIIIKEFSSLCREYGTITAVKDGNFGFLRSSVRDIDLYFRVEDVLDAAGHPASREEVLEGASVSYDIAFTPEERGRKREDTPRGRAIRIMFCDEDLCKDYYVLQSGLLGLVTKEPNKSQPGVLKLVKEHGIGAINDWREGDALGSEGIQIPPEEEYRDVQKVLVKFEEQTQRKEMLLHELSAVHKRAYMLLCKKHRLGYEVQAMQMRNIFRIWKFADEGAYEEWNSTAPPIILGVNDKKADMFTFTRASMNEQFGLALRAMDVTFSLCFNRKTMSRFAGDVTVVDREVVGGEVRRQGVVDSVRNKGMGALHGNIRDLKSQEKLLFHGSGFQDVDTANQISEGTIVSFCVRNRGGMRTAVEIIVDQDYAANQEETLSGTCTAVVVQRDANGAAVILLDTSAVPSLANIYPSFGADIQSAEVSNGISQQVGSDEPPIRHFAPVTRTPIPLVVEAESNTLQPGDLITCEAVINWASSRLPLRAVHPQIVQTAACPKVQGTISKLDIANGCAEVQVDASLIPSHTEEMKEATDCACLFCDSRELVTERKSSRPNLEVGDSVECVAVPTMRLAVAVVRSKPVPKERMRIVVNESLKNKAKLKTGVVMAKGPDGTNGFPPGWREQPNLSGLAWENLVTAT